MLIENMELVGSVDIAEDVQEKVRTVGVRGLDFQKAKELGVFQRIGNILTVMHATMTAANIIYGQASHIMDDLHGRKNEIAREMNMFEKSYERFLRFWTDYYAHGSNAKEVNREVENLYHHIMEWAQIPECWQLGDKQRVEDNAKDIAIRIESPEDDRIYTFMNTSLNQETVEQSDTWGVLCYDTDKDKQTVIHADIDKASALMVAKRMSADDSKNIYTAAVVSDITEKRTDVIPFKSFRNNETVGKLIK